MQARTAPGSGSCNAPEGPRRALLLTLRQSQRLTEAGVPIEILPAWKWLCRREA